MWVCGEACVPCLRRCVRQCVWQAGRQAGRQARQRAVVAGHKLHALLVLPPLPAQIPAHKVKLFVGAGGEKIKFIQRKSKCRIQVGVV